MAVHAILVAVTVRLLALIQPIHYLPFCRLSGFRVRQLPPLFVDVEENVL